MREPSGKGVDESLYSEAGGREALELACRLAAGGGYAFYNAAGAIDFCLVHTLKDVWIVLELGEGQKDVVLEFLPETRARLRLHAEENGRLRLEQQACKARLDLVRA